MEFKKPVNLTLNCAVCGKQAGAFRDAEFEKKLTIRIDTLTQGVFAVEEQSIAAARELFNQPIKIIHAKIKDIRLTGTLDDFKNTHSYGQNLEGIDSYCPDCDKIYCEEHYNVKEGGSYSHSEASGTCPKGHQRQLYLEFHSC